MVAVTEALIINWVPQRLGECVFLISKTNFDNPSKEEYICELTIGKLVESMAIFDLLLQKCYQTHQLVRFSARLWMVAGHVTLSCAPVSEWPVSIVLWNLISRPTLYTCVCVRMRVCTSAAAQARVKRTFSGDKTAFFTQHLLWISAGEWYKSIPRHSHLPSSPVYWRRWQVAALLPHIPCWSCPTSRRSQPLL